MLKVFVLSHDDALLNTVEPAEHIIKINLRKLPLSSELQNDAISESRIFLSDIPENTLTDYIGFFSYRWSTQKFTDRIPLQKLNTIVLEPDRIYCTVFPNWYDNSVIGHPCIESYLHELATYTGLPVNNDPSLCCQQFICAKNVYLDFQVFFRDTFKYFYNKYGFNTFICGVPNNAYDNRMFGLLCERFTMCYFSHVHKKGLQLTEIPKI